MLVKEKAHAHAQSTIVPRSHAVRFTSFLFLRYRLQSGSCKDQAYGSQRMTISKKRQRMLSELHRVARFKALGGGVDGGLTDVAE